MTRSSIADAVRAEYATCADLPAMAARLGVTYAYLKSCASRLGIKNHRPVSDAIQRAGHVPPYVPRYGSTVWRLVKHLRTLPPGAEMSSDAIAELLGIERRQVMMSLVNAAAAGLLKCRKESETYKAPTIWSLGVVPEKPVKEVKAKRQPKPEKKADPKPKARAKPPVSEPWQKMAKTTWANAATQRLNAGRKPAVKPADAPVVIPANVKITRCPTPVDTRFSADPGYVGPFSMVGIGRNVETGRAW